ncbi:DegV family protein with EDD domain [Tamaricihabitans halophyticus]|uniref:DegV family protein with EDD domain n=1 Tax=Tamaricihabitans halophyticus TaxID=1262583 RepID=A0A4R2QTQ0_9PSEU|nr:DegV family protein [Tamaricihabitans halophyticus]TCP52108.1 DegV family protein with EDD domain [Tamaricihabitans halophyticus]
MSVAVVTDSTACLPAELADELGIAVVQVQLKMGDLVNDEARVPIPEVIEAMRAGTPVSTTPPDPNAFFWTYQQAASTGADAIVSLQISGRMSATVDAARQAAEHVSVPVHVVDSRTTGMSLGFAALSAARVSGAGGNARRVITAAEDRLAGSTELLYVDTLEYLRKGGRIGAARALLGSALSIKPLLTVQDGEVAPLARARGTKRAINRMLELATERAGGARTDLAITSFGADEQAELVRDRLSERIAGANAPRVVACSTVIGAHCGPGAFSITVSTA